SALRRRGSAADPGAAGPCQPFDHAGIHGGRSRTPARGVRCRPPPGLMRSGHNPALCAAQLPSTTGFPERRSPLAPIRTLFLALALLIAQASVLAAQAPSCSGRNMLDEMKDTDAAAHSRVMAAAAETQNANALLWRIERAGTPASYL